MTLIARIIDFHFFYLFFILFFFGVKETLIIWGDKDNVFPVCLAYQLQRYLTKSFSLSIHFFFGFFGVPKFWSIQITPLNHGLQALGTQVKVGNN